MLTVTAPVKKSSTDKLGVAYFKDAPSPIEEKCIRTGCVEIHGLPENPKKDILQMLLENQKRSGGGPVLDLQIDERGKIAIVTFEDPAGSSAKFLKHFIYRLTKFMSCSLF